MNEKTKKWLNMQYGRLNFSDDKIMKFNEIMETFSKQRHSGSSASYAIGIIKKYPDKSKEEIFKELESLNKDNDKFQTSINNNIIEILNLLENLNFDKEDLNRIYRLLDWKPIIPLTGEEDEWQYTGFDTDEQNILCSSVFRKNYDNSTAYYISGKIFSDNGGFSWYTNKNSFIKVEFPFIVPDKAEKVYLDKDGNDITGNKKLIEKLCNEEKKEYDKIYTMKFMKI